MTFKKLHGLVVGVVLGAASMLIGGVAGAQSLVQPPVISAIDQNGVNLANGQFSLPGLNIAIGSGQSSIGRQVINGTDNFSDLLTQQLVGSTFGGTSKGALYLNASYNGQIYRFHFGDLNNGTNTLLTGPYLAAGGIPAQLYCGTNGSLSSGDPCVMTLPDGTRVTYTNTLPAQSGYGSASSIKKPDGELISFTYYANASGINQAIQSVSSSLGWMLKYQVDGSYNVNQVTAINTSATYCSPTATCSVDPSYPTVQLTTSGTTNTITQNGINLLSYSVSGSVTTITSPKGVTETITKNSSGAYNGWVSSVSKAGSTWSYAYSTDVNGNLTTTVTEPNLSTRRLVTSYDYKTSSQTDEAGRTTQYLYDTFNRVIEVINPDGNASTGGFTQYVYDAYNNITNTIVVPKGGATGGVPNTGAAMVTTSTYPAGCTNYVLCRKPTAVLDTNGVETDYTYDPTHGGVLTATLPSVGGVRAQTRYTYAQQTPHNYEVGGSLGTLAAAGPVYRVTRTSSCMSSNWNSSTNSCTGGASDENQSNIVYNSTNILPITATTSLGDGSLGQAVTTAYTNNGWVFAVDGPKPGAVDETYYFYDARGRKVGMEGMDPDGAASRHRQASHTYFDIDGNVTEVDNGTVGNGTTNIYTGTDAATRYTLATADWNGMTSTSTQVQERNTNEFDSYERPTIARHYIGNSTTALDVTQRSYDAMQRVDCEAVRLNSADYPNLSSIAACSLGTTSADGSHDRITKFAYDVLSNVTSTISAFGTGSARTDFIKVYDVQTATSAGTLTSAVDGNGNKTGYYYDGFNRLIKTCYPTAGAGSAINANDCDQTAYQSTNVTGVAQATNLVSSVTARDNTTVIGFGYDALGRMASKTGAVHETFSYNNFAQVLTHNVTSGPSETYIYNAMGWLLSDAQPLGTVTYGYDGYGKRNLMTYPGTGLYITYAYDDGDELTGIYENGTTALLAGFGYDDYGRRTTLSRGNGVSTTYGFDNNLRLQSVTQGTTGAAFYNQVTYGYNTANQINSKAGNNAAYNYTPAPKSISYGIDGLNRIGTISGTNFTYDLRGNLQSDGGSDTYTYNAYNLMTVAVQSNVTTNLGYDAETRLMSISQNGTTTQFLYDGTDLIGEYNASGTLLRRYVHGPGDDEPLVWYDVAGGNKYYLGADDNSSISVVTNNSGSQYAINTYDEYGMPGSGNAGRFQYTGQNWLPEIKMYYFKARLYSPVLGRFMQRDPTGYGDGMNAYSYTHDDPIDGSDPAGLATTAGAQGPANDSTVTVTCDAACQFAALNRQCASKGASQCWSGDNYCYSTGNCHPLDKGEVNDTVAPWELIGPGDAEGLFLGGKFLFTEVAEHLPQLGKGLIFVAKTACFEAGTKIATPNGLRNIEDIKVGDLVLSYDVDSRKVVTKPVTELIRNPPQATYQVSLKAAHGDSETIRVTAEHPWLMTSGEWEGTKSLQSGDMIQSASGITLAVVSVKATGKVKPVYNFTVAGTHTYLVGRNHAVVHNSCVKEGIYWFKVGEKWYVGQSGNIARRLAQHLRIGFLKDGVNVETLEVLGGKTAREVAEQLKINEFTEGRGAESEAVANQRNPIGPARANLMPPKP